MEIVKETKIPDEGMTQRYDVVKELGDCYASVGDYNQAHACYERATALAPDEAGPYIGLGVIAMQQGDRENAETAFKVARRLDSGDSKAYCGLAMVYQHSERYAEAFELYLKSLEINSNDLTALLGLFQVSCQMKSFSKVIYYLQLYLDMHPGDTAVMFCLAALQLKDGNVGQAKDILLGILALEPDNSDAQSLLEEAEHILAEKNIKN